MALDRIFKLEKLKVSAYSDDKRTKRVGTFEAMFNPESLKRKYEILYGRGQGHSSSDQAAVYSRNPPSDLQLQLLLDGTGVNDLGVVKSGSGETVSDQVKQFLRLTYEKNGDIHEPNYLLVEWGDLSFSCRLATVEVSYTSFDRDGKPLRAELNATFVSDMEVKKRLSKENTKSSDLTHRRVVKAGDTLPLLTKEIYGSAKWYLWVARLNGLDDFRNLTPGLELSFPPLDAGASENKRAQ